MSVGRTVSRSIGKEIEGLLGKRAARAAGDKGAKLGAAAWTERVAKRVLGKDVAKVGGEAGHLARLRVEAKAPARRAKAAVLENQSVGKQREGVVARLLRALFPKAEGYAVHREQYLRTRGGKIAKDAATGESRRLDFVVFRDREVVRTLEVTSEQVSKAQQLAKETRMRRDGAKWLVHPESERLVRIPAKLKTKVIRLP